MALKIITPAQKLQPAKPVIGVGPKGTITKNGDWVITDQSYNLANDPTKHGLSLYGGGNLIGYGNAGGSSKLNTLTAASNTGDTTLIAGTASTTMIGGSGNNWLDARPSQGTVSLRGGTGSSTMLAANGAATLVAVGNANARNSLVAGTSVTRTIGQSLVGGSGSNTLVGGRGRDTLTSAGGVNLLLSGSALNGSNTLIAGGTSTLRAGAGNDSLYALRGDSTLYGNNGRTTLSGPIGPALGAGGGSSWLQSGSSLSGGNTLLGGIGSNTLVAGKGRDSIVGGDFQNLLLVNDENATAFATDRVTLSTRSTASNTLGISAASPVDIQDSLLGTMASSGVKNLRTAANLSSTSRRIVLGANAEAVGIATVVAGTDSRDTLSVAGFATNSVLLDGSKGGNRVSLVGGGTGSGTFLGSRGGYDTMIGAAGSDLFVIQRSALTGSSFGVINGNGGTDTLQLGAAVTLAGTNFNGVSNVEVLALAVGNNSVGSLQGSGIQQIIGNSGSDTISANVYGSVRSVTRSGSSSITLNVTPGTSATMGFAVGQVITGNGIALGTTITGIVSTPPVGLNSGTVTLTLSTPTIAQIAQGGAVNGWINGATLDGGINTTGSNAAPDAKGDYLVGYGQSEYLFGARNSGIQRVSNTLVSGAFASNTLVGGSGNNLYLINNLPGAAALPTIQNPTTLQSASTIQFTGNGVRLDDTALSSVSPLAAQKIVTANGNNLISIGANAAQIGIQTIIGGVGSDTFTTPFDYAPSVYFDASRGSGNQSLASGTGNDTLLAGSGNATLVGGDGNNSLKGGLGNNLILSGVGNSTLDGGFGISTLQADGGLNRFIVRNRYTRILNPYTLERDPVSGVVAPPDPAPIATTPEIGLVDTYVNFDPILGSPVSQFDPGVPDNSPSITKSPSFASSDLSSFYNLQYFNLLGSANYGVGNALDNSISSAAANALILGMGGNNTLVAKGAGSTLYGNSYAKYASPDLYAYAPIDTRTQAFFDGVMGVAGNNSLVASGSNSYLDGGSGYDDGLFNGSGANTLIGTGSNDTLIVSHLADFVSLSGNSHTIITSVDLYQTPDNASDIFVNVTPQFANSGQVQFEGQRMTASYVAISGAQGAYTDTNSLKAGSAPEIVVNNSARIQVLYGTSDGTVYGTGDVADANLPLTVGDFTPDPKNPGKEAVTLSWTTPLDPDGNEVGHTMGYLVNYQLVATDADGNILSQTPYLTYLSGTSQDLKGTSTDPSLLVDNLPTSFIDPYTGVTYDSSNATISYSFKVTAKQTVLPAYTDADGNLIASPLTLIGGEGNDVIYGGIYSNSNLTRPVITENPQAPGVITTPAPWQLAASQPSNLFPTYVSGGLSGDDLLIAARVNDGSGNDFTAYEYINGEPRAVTFSGLNTLVGGQGSDTFIVLNGGTNLDTLNGVVTTGAYDHIIKYGSETPSGQDNLVVSFVQYLSLSDTVVDQGKYINTSWAALSGQYIGGNRLDNTLSSYGTGNTLLGAGGRDLLDASTAAGPVGAILIGGTTYGLDSIAGALADYANGLTSSIYRDTDPVPVNPNGPGTADNSQYWWNPNTGLYDPLRNSDTLLASDHDDLLDGGAGNDSMVGGTGTDTLYVSSDLGDQHNTLIRAGDVVIGGGSAHNVGDWIVYTGSDAYWSGRAGATTTARGYALSYLGDAVGGQSISNIKLQDGDPIAIYATGNTTSVGNQSRSNLGQELGSNWLVGNEFSNTLNGDGVGGTNGRGVGVDTLTGGTGADYFIIGSEYSASASDDSATYVFLAGANRVADYRLTSYRTDGDYALITDFEDLDSLVLSGTASQYFIGASPSGFTQHNIRGGSLSATSTDFGIYRVTGDGPNLVAQVQGLALGSLGSIATVGGTPVDGLNSTNADPNHLGGNLGSNGVTGQNYLGVGAMYNLQGSDFASHVTFG